MRGYLRLQTLKNERKSIDGQIQELEIERSQILGSPRKRSEEATITTYFPGEYDHPASPQILRLLTEIQESNAHRRVDRTWLDGQLVGRVEGVKTTQAVSFGLIELKRRKLIDYIGKPIKTVWLLSASDGVST
jgi:hypothetical protein